MESWNKCVEELTQNFEQIRNEVLVKGEKELLSPKVVMTDVTSQLVDYYFAVTLGKGLTANAEIESSALAEEVHTVVSKPRELTPLEIQNKLFAESKQRMSKNLNTQLATPVTAPLPNSVVPQPVRLTPGSSRATPITVGGSSAPNPINQMYATRFPYQYGLLNNTQPTSIYRPPTTTPPVRYPQQPQPRGYM